VTELLLERLPNGHVVALDGSPSMVELAGVLRPGGRLAAQCGGAGNIASVATALREMGQDPFGAKTYATPEETAARLERSGFVQVECRLHPEPTPFGSLEELATCLRTVALGDHVDGMPEARRPRSRWRWPGGCRPWRWTTCG